MPHLGFGFLTPGSAPNLAPHPAATRRARLARRAIGAVFVVALACNAERASAAPRLASAAPPAVPVWPAPALRDGFKDLLKQYYGQRASDGSNGFPLTSHFLLAPEYESDKAPAKKDPDTLLAYFGGPGTNCYGATTRADFLTCAGKRLGMTLNFPYTSGLTIYDPARGYYALDLYARMACYFALYHAFVHDFDSTILAPNGYTPATARQAQMYHRAMIRAYEAQARDIIVRLFADTQADTPANYEFQRNLTRTAGLLESAYVPLVVFLDKYNAWDPGRPWDRKNARAVINALSSRVWYEWVWTQANGPATAGFVNLGSRKTYAQALAVGQATPGSDVFSYAFEPGTTFTTVPSLRSANADDPAQGGTDGFWFDADYSTPGEWWCQATYGAGTSDLAKCMAQAARVGHDGAQTPPGPYTPFGQYYGDPGNPVNPCGGRTYGPSTANCGDTNLGSIGEEWLWTTVGARSGMYYLSRLAPGDRPAGALGPGMHTIKTSLNQTLQQSEYQIVTDRLGYGVSGWHGGAGHDDDMEWLWSPDGNTRAIRTMSAGRHDDEPQNGRYSVGEQDTLPGITAVKGDTWNLDGQEFGGAIENHSPGPSALYGTLLFNLLLGDKTTDAAGSQSGLSGSLFDGNHRNKFDEFTNWIWLFAGTTGRCTNVSDPADPSCFDVSSVNRKPLYANPAANPSPLRFAYLWRDDSSVLDTGHVADLSPANCRNRGGVPWRHVADKTSGSATNAPYLLDEGGYGAYNDLVQLLGGLMRVTAERYPQAPPGEDVATQRAQVLKPWYDAAYGQMEAIQSIFKNAPPTGLGYVPDLENSSCVTDDPGTPATDQIMAGWQQGVGDSVNATTLRRAMLYSLTALWYWWYDSGWLAAGG